MSDRVEVTVEEIACLRWLADLEPLDADQAVWYEIFNEQAAEAHLYKWDGIEHDPGEYEG